MEKTEINNKKCCGICDEEIDVGVNGVFRFVNNKLICNKCYAKIIKIDELDLETNSESHKDIL